MKFCKLIFLVFSAAIPAFAAGEDSNLIAVGQGVSSPTSTSTVNYSNGYNSENPVGVLYQNSTRLSLQYDQNDSGNSKAYGVELGVGKKDWGMALGYYKADCSGCEGRVAADFAGSSGQIGFGIRLSENQYTLGLLFGVTDKHRFGVVLSTDDSGGTGNKINSYGLGYSYVGTDFSFALDASKRQNENSSANNDVILVTPGVSVSTSVFQLSVNDRFTIDNTNKTTTSDLWFGIGFGGKSWHFVGYSDYVKDIALVASFYF